MRAKLSPGAVKVVRQTAVALIFTVVVVVLLLWLAGSFHRKIDTTAAAVSPEPTGRPVGAARLIPVRVVRVPRVETAVGTIGAVHEASVASKLLAKVTEVRVRAGQTVEESQVLVRLDDAELRARLQQARAAADAARAARDQANIEYDRVRNLFEQSSAARIELDRAATAVKSAEAELQRAEQAASEAATYLEYATIRSPLDGVVIDRKVEPGDTVTPGQVVVSLYDPTRMQLVASVRESLTHRLWVGQDIDVRVEAIDKTCLGRVSEIVPEAQSASRTFSVKVTGPCPPGIYSGMFGRLLIPLDEEEVLVVPREAIRRVGQLDIADVVDGDALHRRAVQLGRSFGDDVEVLSGLRQGELVALRGHPQIAAPGG